MKSVTESYWVDDYENRWNKEKFTEEEALRASQNLVACSGCVDCVNCKYCVGCVDCTLCFECAECKHCKECDSCTSCWLCTDCEECDQCSQCVSIELVSGGKEMNGYED